MTEPLHTVVETLRFVRDSDHVGMREDERTAIVNAIAKDPSQGDEVQGSGGIRKVRVAGRGKGKSGGYRVMTAYLVEDVPAYLLAVLSKGNRANFDASEIASMRKATVAIKQAWQERRRR